MRVRMGFARLLPLPGLSVMVVAGVRAVRYEPSWWDVGETCVNRIPCFTEAESASTLQNYYWVAWAGLLLVVLGIWLCAFALSSAPRSTPSVSGVAVHASVSGVVAGPTAAVGLALGFFAVFMGGALGVAVVAIAWLGLACALEALDQALGRERSARAAYLLSVGAGLAGLATLTGTLAVLGLGLTKFACALVLSSLAVAAVTALGDVVQDCHVQPWAGWTAAPVTGLAVLGALAGSLVLNPPKVWPAGTWSSADVSVPAPSATSPLLPVPTTTPFTSTTPTPSHTPTSVNARRPCSPGDLTLAVGEFEAATGR